MDITEDMEITIFSDSDITVKILNNEAVPGRDRKLRVAKIQERLERWKPMLKIKWVPAHILDEQGKPHPNFKFNHMADELAGEGSKTAMQLVEDKLEDLPEPSSPCWIFEGYGAFDLPENLMFFA